MPVAQLELKPAAAEIYRSPARVKVVFSGRRFGKTRLGLTWLIEKCLTEPGSKCFYLAPSRKQAKDIAWADLKSMVPQSWLDRTYESQLSLNFRNGSCLILAGADYADGLRGQSARAIVVDEHAYVSNLQEMWEGALLPMLGTTRGDVLFISTPAGGGNFASELWERAKNTPDWERWSFKSTDGGWIDETFVQEAKATMDPILWRQEFQASIESLLGSVYSDFNRDNIAPTDFWRNERLVFGVDFNRTPFCGCILQVQGDRLAVLKEYVLINSDTHEMAKAVRADFPYHEILACPDPTGRRLQTSSAMGLSDHAILKQYSFVVKAPRAPWSIRDKVSATRLMVRDANGHRRLKVDPSCKRVIRSLSNLEYRAGTSVPDPKSDHSHMADALVYACIALQKGLLPWSLGVTGFRIS